MNWKQSIPRLFVIISVTFVLCSLISCGKKHNATAGSQIIVAAKNGDLEKVKALLKANPDLVSSKDNGDFTPCCASTAERNKLFVGDEVTSLILIPDFQLKTLCIVSDANQFPPRQFTGIF
jgi:hypothetical protein